MLRCQKPTVTLKWKAVNRGTHQLGLHKVRGVHGVLRVVLVVPQQGRDVLAGLGRRQHDIRAVIGTRRVIARRGQDGHLLPQVQHDDLQEPCSILQTDGGALELKSYNTNTG